MPGRPRRRAWALHVCCPAAGRRSLVIIIVVTSSQVSRATPDGALRACVRALPQRQAWLRTVVRHASAACWFWQESVGARGLCSERPAAAALRPAGRHGGAACPRPFRRHAPARVRTSVWCTWNQRQGGRQQQQQRQRARRSGRGTRPVRVLHAAVAASARGCGGWLGGWRSPAPRAS